jgi:hypothetical protein
MRLKYEESDDFRKP